MVCLINKDWEGKWINCVKKNCLNVKYLYYLLGKFIYCGKNYVS